VDGFAPIALDRDAEVPLGTQLTWALRARVAGGELVPGTRLPGAKELAAQSGVNVNTVRSVYARLADEGLLLIAHGRGTFVAARPDGDDATALAAAVTSEARRRGIDPRAVAAAVYVQESAAPAAAAPERDELRREIAALERQLARLPAAPLHEADPPAAAGRLLSAAELRRQRDALVEEVALRAADASGEPDGSVEPPAAEKRAADSRSTATRAHGAKLRWRPA
jgi:GntR family transcriptional regulator